MGRKLVVPRADSSPRLGRKFIHGIESTKQVLGCKVTNQSWCAQTWAAHSSPLALSRAQPRLGRKFIHGIESTKQVLSCKFTHQSWLVRPDLGGKSIVPCAESSPRLGRMFVVPIFPRSGSLTDRPVARGPATLGCQWVPCSWRPVALAVQFSHRCSDVHNDCIRNGNQYQVSE